MKSYTRNIAFLVTLLVTLAFSCQSGQKAPETAQPDTDPNLLSVSKIQFQTNDMVLEKGSQRTFAEILHLSGILDVPPENRAVVSAVSGGFVKRISLIEGNQVQKGFNRKAKKLYQHSPIL